MKLSNILVMSLLFAAGSAFGAGKGLSTADLTKFTNWAKKEDATAWDQNRVDSMLNQIDSKMEGNKGTLNPLRKEIVKKWDAAKNLKILKKDEKKAEKGIEKLEATVNKESKDVDKAEKELKKAQDNLDKQKQEEAVAQQKLADKQALERDIEEQRLAKERELKKQILETNAKELTDEQALKIKADGERIAQQAAEKQKRKNEENAAQAAKEQAAAEQAAKEQAAKEQAAYMQETQDTIQNLRNKLEEGVRLTEKETTYLNSSTSMFPLAKEALAINKALHDLDALRDTLVSTDKTVREKAAARIDIESIMRRKDIGGAENVKTYATKLLDRITKLEKEADALRIKHEQEKAAAEEIAKKQAAKNQATYMQETQNTLQKLRNKLEEGVRLTEEETTYLKSSTSMFPLAKEALAINKALHDLDDMRNVLTSTDKTAIEKSAARNTIQEIIRRNEINNAPSVKEYATRILERITKLEKEADALRIKQEKEQAAAEKDAKEESARDKQKAAQQDAEKKEAEERALLATAETDLKNTDKNTGQDVLAEILFRINTIKKRNPNNKKIQNIAEDLLKNNKIKTHRANINLIEKNSLQVAAKKTLSEDGYIFAGDKSKLESIKSTYPAADFVLKANDSIKRYNAATETMKKNLSLAEISAIIQAVKARRDNATIEDEASLYNSLVNDFNKALDLEDVWPKKK